uniref:Uncharacterized protein n=1 Tax=Rhizophora mucronata TaxID=61149 RepID=A0A2P2Q8S1_RHIMU
MFSSKGNRQGPLFFPGIESSDHQYSKCPVLDNL